MPSRKNTTLPHDLLMAQHWVPGTDTWHLRGLAGLGLEARLRVPKHRNLPRKWWDLQPICGDDKQSYSQAIYSNPTTNLAMDCGGHSNRKFVSSLGIWWPCREIQRMLRSRAFRCCGWGFVPIAPWLPQDSQVISSPVSPAIGCWSNSCPLNFGCITLGPQTILRKMEQAYGSYGIHPADRQWTVAYCC